MNLEQLKKEIIKDDGSFSIHHGHISWMLQELGRMQIAVSEMERMKATISEELAGESRDFEDLGWKQTLVAELSLYQKYLYILKGEESGASE